MNQKRTGVFRYNNEQPKKHWSCSDIVPTKYTACSALENFDVTSIMRGLLYELNAIQDKLLRQVLTKCLGRPTVNEDAKRMTLYYHPFDLSLEIVDVYDVAFDNVKIGRVVMKKSGEPYGSTYTVTFHPEKT